MGFLQGIEAEWLLSLKGNKGTSADGISMVKHGKTVVLKGTDGGDGSRRKISILKYGLG